MKTRVNIGDEVTWQGPRNFQCRPVTGRVVHVGRLFVSVRRMSTGRGYTTDTYIAHNKLLSINGAAVPGKLQPTQTPTPPSP